MHRFRPVALVLFILGFCSGRTLTAASVPAFSGALGFGNIATGGRGDTVYHVTNLNDSGTGSFRDAVSASGRTIVFDVGGNIQALSPVSVSSNLTIAGQTAPGGGIGIFGSEVSFSGASNDIVRFLRFRDGTLDPNYPGSSATNSHTNAINLDSATSMMFDHCSFEFAAYNNVDAVGAVNLTFQNCIFADPIAEQRFNCHFENGPATFIDNLWANSHGRNPLAKGNLQFVNNIVYNYGYAFTTGNSSGHFDWDIINNYFIAGPSTTSAGDAFYQVDSNQSAYAIGNILDSNKDAVLNGSADNSTGAVALSTYYFGASAAVPTSSLPTLSPVDAFKFVTSNAGPQPLDQVDTLVLGDVQSLGKSGMLWTTQTSTGLGNSGYGVIAGGIPLTDSDGDGMPDVWENAVGLNPSSATDGATVISSGSNTGYTNLEVYLNWLAGPHGIVFKNTVSQPTSLDIDLRQYTAGYTGSVTFGVTNPLNGVVTILADGHTAHFVPTANFFGLASYGFSVTDGTSTMTKTVSVVVSSTPPPVDVVWHGDSISNNWDSTTTEWTAPNGSAIVFVAGDGVTFDDTGSNSPAVNLTGPFAPSELEINTYTNSYVLSGTGSLTGGMTLVKNGSASLTINTGNTFSGAVTLNSGNVTLGSTAALGTGAVTLGGNALTLPGGGGTFGNALVVNGTSSITWTSNSNMYLAGAVTGAANLTLNFSNKLLTFQGNWSAYQGTLDTGASTGAIRLYSGASLNFGAATVNLGNATLYPHDEGTTTLSFGALNGNASANLGGDNGSTSSTNTYTIGALNLNSTFAGSINNGSASGNLVNLTKTGSGVLTLSGTSTYTGPTVVSGGALVVNGGLGNTAVTVTSGALYGAGTIGSSTGGAVSMQAGTILSPGVSGAGNFGTFTVGHGLTLTNATVLLDLSSNPSGSNDKIVMQGGTIALAGTTTMALNLVNSVLGAGTYNLISGGTATTGGASNLNLGLPTGARQNFVISTTGGAVKLTVTGTAASLVWQGGVNGGLWDANSTANWSNSGSTDKFYNFDAVTFDDTAATGSVVIGANVQPRSITVTDNTLNYTFTGSSIGGTGQLVKNGAGTLTLSVPVLSGSATTNGTTAVVLASPTVLYPGMTVTGSGITAGTTILSVTDSTHITLSQAATAGAATLTFYAADTYSGGTVINGGAITLGSYAANDYGLGTGSVTLNTGTLNMFSAGTATDAGTLSNPIIVNTFGTLNTAPRCTISSSLTGSGTLIYNTTYVRTALTGDWSGFTGEINVTGGGNFRITPSYFYPGFPLAGINLGTSYMYFAGTVGDTGIIIPIGELSGGASSGLQGGPTGSGGRPFTWMIGGRNTDATFAGSIVEQGPGTTVTSIDKVGTGTWTLSGTSNIDGDFLIQQGRLQVSGSITNGGAFEAQNATTLNLVGGSITTASVQIDGGGALSGAGTINGSLTNQGTATINGNGALTVNGNFENDGTMMVDSGSSLVVNLPTDG
jgi:autotransporter-associated beta strand protein